MDLSKRGMGFETARSKVIKLNVDDSGKSIIAYPGLKKEDVNIIAEMSSLVV